MRNKIRAMLVPAINVFCLLQFYFTPKSGGKLALTCFSGFGTSRIQVVVNRVMSYLTPLCSDFGTSDTSVVDFFLKKWQGFFFKKKESNWSQEICIHKDIFLFT
jgi:hypothetical protein